MADKNNVYKYDKKNIQGGAGRLLWNSNTSNRPKKISDVMDLESFEAKEGWNDLGATNEGIAQSRGFDTEDVEIDQSKTPIDTSVSSWTNAISTTLMETSIENRQLVNVGGAISETPAVLGIASKTTAAIPNGTKLIKVTDGTEFAKSRFIKIGDETIAVGSADGDVIRLKKAIDKEGGYPADTDVLPVKELGTKTISYGAPESVPAVQLALISQREDGTLLMIVYYEVKLNGDEVESTFNKEKRTLPVGFVAFAQDDLPEDENVYIEVEQTLL
ncbi:hypothetical protein VBH15_09455 [Vagococcus fluvialis]|uniref:hypothetical protein n=1 Tax=Vagococcus fluvialis TaxID=2738 RepID=UPI0037D252FC